MNTDVVVDLTALSLQPPLLDVKPPHARQPGTSRAASRWRVSAAGLLVLSLGTGLGWAGNYSFRNIVDGSNSFVNLYSASINSAGVVAFYADSTSGVSGVYRSDGASTTTIVDTSSGQFAFPVEGCRPTIDDDGTVAFFIYHVIGSAQVGSIRTGTGGATVVIAEASDTGPFYGVYGDPCIRNGMVSFYGMEHGKGDHEGVFTAPARGGSHSTIAQSGGKFWDADVFGATSINAGGQVAYWGVLADASSGIFVGPNGATTIAQTGSRFSSLGNPKISDSGAVAFYAQLSDGSSGDFVSQGGTVTQVTMAGGGVVAAEFPSINAAGTVAGRAFLNNGGWAIVAGPNPVVDKVIGLGDPLFGSAVAFLMGQPGNNGLNNSGQIVFIYALGNGGSGIALATPVVSPALRFQALDPTHAQFAWPTNATGFVLESASSLPASAWHVITNAPVLNGDQFATVLKMGSTQQFFRLHRQ